MRYTIVAAYVTWLANAPKQSHEVPMAQWPRFVTQGIKPVAFFDAANDKEALERFDEACKAADRNVHRMFLFSDTSGPEGIATQEIIRV